MQSTKAEREVVAVVARNVRNTRKALGLFQGALADAAGVDRTYVSQVERRLRSPTIVVLAGLAKALETTPDRLLAPTKVASETARTPARGGRQNGS